MLTGINSEEDLEQALARPSRRDIEFASDLEGDVLILGAGGKMGPTLARRVAGAFAAVRRSNRTYAVARFSDRKQYERLASLGIGAIRADLWDEQQLAALPESPNILYYLASGAGGIAVGVHTTMSQLTGFLGVLLAPETKGKPLPE